MICNYDPVWTEEFERETWLLTEVLGEFIKAAHHVESTAVQGLAARLIIDIAVESTEFLPGPVIEDTLRVLEYFPDHDLDNRDVHCLKKWNPRGFCLYWHPMHPSGCEFIKKQLAFRDLLRNDHESAYCYGAIKRLFANEFHNYPPEYDRNKGTVIDVMLKMAEIWG